MAYGDFLPMSEWQRIVQEQGILVAGSTDYENASPADIRLQVIEKRCREAGY